MSDEQPTAGEPVDDEDKGERSQTPEADSPGSQPDAPEQPEAEGPKTSEGAPQPEPSRQDPAEAGQPEEQASPEPEEADEPEEQASPEPEEADEPEEVAAAEASEPLPPTEERRPLLIFLNEVAGGRKLLAATRERADNVSYVAVVAPQNNPAAGQIVDAGELRDAALSRVEVTMSILAGFGIDSVGEVMDRDSSLALDDAIRAHEPAETLLSCLPESRFGLTRKDLLAWAEGEFSDRTTITHIPVRITDDSIRWDVTHTLVVATQTVSSPDLVGRLKQLNSERPHRYTFICPRSGDLSREEVCDRLAETLVEMYREGIDATGQPMSPDPFSAVQNAVEHYRIDEVLISTLAGEKSKWLEEGLIGQVREITDKPVEHIEAGRPPEAVAAAVAGGDVSA